MNVDPDVVVVGAGTAGLPLAITAAEQGLLVAVVDAADEIGGTLHVSAGHMSAAGTRRQQAAGILDDTPELHYADVMRISGGHADPSLVRLAVEEAPRTIDWLDDLGFPFDPGTPAVYYGHEPYSRPRTHWGIGNGRAILDTLRVPWQALVDRGRIVPLLGHRCEGLLEDAGSVTGVRLDNGERLRGTATVLATGGYGANAALFEALTPGAPRLVTNAVPTSDGSGIELARSVGARLRGGEHHTPRLGLLEIPAGSGRTDFWSAMAHLTAVERPPREIWVNSLGRRFVAEDLTDVTAHEHAVRGQPGEEFWIVFDDAAVDDGGPLVRQWSADELRARAGTPEIPLWFATDVRGLARLAGVDSDGLAATVEDFNAAVAAGQDALGRVVLDHPVRTPPFYALRITAAVLCTFGGLSVDADLRVLGDDGTPIRGLYAAGEALGMAATSGRAFCGGMAVTPALSFGRILGQRLAGAAVPPGART
jgi:fumarate reductase flavoprotein subunit